MAHSPTCEKSECFQFYWLFFKPNQISLLKWDNEAALAAAACLHDHQGVRNRARLPAESPSPSLGCLESSFIREARDLASVTAVMSSFSSSQLLGGFLGLLSTYFYPSLLQRMWEHLCMLVLWGVRNSMPGNAIGHWAQKLPKVMLSIGGSLYQEGSYIFAISCNSTVSLKKTAVFFP